MGQPLSRRRVLVALLAGAAVPGVLSACTGSTDPETPTTTAPAAPDPLLALLDERARLLEEYDAAARRHPELAPRLLPLRSQTAEQVVALRLALALPDPTTAEPSSSATATSSAEPEPVDPAETLAALRAAVQASSVTAATLCETTTPERAPLVGSLAAAATCHGLLLQ